MNELFNISLTYQGKELELKARFERYGYIHRISVLFGEQTVAFEPDEEGSYRALGDGGVELPLLQAVAEKIATLVCMNE